MNSNGQLDYKGIPVLFPKFKVLSYNGFSYGLPIVNGVGKQIKGKEIVLLVRAVKYEDYKELEVIYIKSIDGKQFNTHDITGKIIQQTFQTV